MQLVICAMTVASFVMLHVEKKSTELACVNFAPLKWLCDKSGHCVRFYLPFDHTKLGTAAQCLSNRNINLSILSLYLSISLSLSLSLSLSHTHTHTRKKSMLRIRKTIVDLLFFFFFFVDLLEFSFCAYQVCKTTGLSKKLSNSSPQMEKSCQKLGSEDWTHRRSENPSNPAMQHPAHGCLTHTLIRQLGKMAADSDGPSRERFRAFRECRGTCRELVS